MTEYNNRQISAAEALVLRFYEAMNSGDEAMLDSVADEVLAPNWVSEPLPPGSSAGPENFKPTTLWLRSVFPDFTITHEDTIVSDGRIAVRSVSSGTHSGELLGVPATGRHVEYRAFDFHHVEGGRIVRTWHLEDYFSLLSQLGATVAVAT